MTSKRLTTQDLSPFFRNSVGIDRLFDNLTRQMDSSSVNYPPYDIVQLTDDEYEIRIAVAGFADEDLEIQAHNGMLTITGSKPSQQGEDFKYLHNGISSRGFKREFTLADHVEVRDAILRDGILTVKLTRVVPEALKPRTIAITHMK